MLPNGVNATDRFCSDNRYFRPGKKDYMPNTTKTVEAIFSVSGIQIPSETLQNHQSEHHRLVVEADKLSLLMSKEDNRDVTPVTTFLHPDVKENKK